MRNFSIIDSAGKTVKGSANESVPRGIHRVFFEGTRDLPSIHELAGFGRKEIYSTFNARQRRFANLVTTAQVSAQPLVHHPGQQASEQFRQIPGRLYIVIEPIPNLDQICRIQKQQPYISQRNL
jgi:hypothetical protein